MSNESGDKKLLGNFRKLIDFVSVDPNYNPANQKLVKTRLELQYTAGQAAAEALLGERGPYKLAVTDRQVGYDELPTRFTRSFNMLKSSGAPKEVVADAEPHKRKILGTRKSPKPKPTDGANPAAPGTGSNGGESATHSASQTSHESLLGHASAYLAIVRNVPSYNPNEADLKVPALEAFIASLETKNNAVNAAFVAVSQARGLRDGLLYTNDDSVVDIALLVKAYVKAAFGTQSQLYKQIKGLKFVRQTRD
jgi:hypothetical protein